MKDYYAILQIDRSADQREIREAYYELERHYNPALNPGEEGFDQIHQNIIEAYEVLGLEHTRREYDEQYDQYPWEQVRIDRIVRKEARGMIFYTVCFIFVLVFGMISFNVMPKYFPPHPPDVKQENTMIDSVGMESIELPIDSIAAIDTAK